MKDNEYISKDDFLCYNCVYEKRCSRASFYQWKPMTCPEFRSVKFENMKVNVKNMKNFDKEKFERWLANNAKPKSTGYCARHVRLALEASGLEIAIYPPSAYLYKTLLPLYDFKEVKVNIKNYKPKVADIVVWGKNEITRHGHIQGYTNIGWVSDFLQKTIYPNSKHPNVWINGGYSIFRRYE